MAEQLFITTQGFAVDDSSGQLFSILPTNGAPGGDSSHQDAAQVGSIALDSSTGALYQKTSSGSGTNKWTLSGSQLTATWRPPVRVVDASTWADIAAVQTELNDISTPGSIGGVDSDQFADGDRILITDLTSGNENVYIVTGTPGSSATLVEDQNSASDGDTVFVQEGTAGDQQYAYDGTGWFQVLGNLNSELGFIRSFIGKSAAGSETPDYGAGTTYIGQTDDLETAISKLDTGLGEARTYLTQAGVTTQVTADSILVDDYDSVHWRISAKAADGSIRQFDVLAIHDGTSSSDATSTDFSIYAKLRIGSINGFSVDVDVNGTGATQTMRLLAESTTSVTIKVTRMMVM
jgi:hypothetical protein